MNSNVCFEIYALIKLKTSKPWLKTIFLCNEENIEGSKTMEIHGPQQKALDLPFNYFNTLLCHEGFQW